MSNPIKENRLGSFYIPKWLYEADDHTALDAVFQDVYITRMEYLYHSNSFECVGYSRHFEIIKKENSALFYDIEFRRHNDESITHRWVKRRE